MNSIELIRLALDLPVNWEVKDFEFSGDDSQSLHITTCYTRKDKFLNENGSEIEICNFIDRSFRYKNLFELTCYIHCLVPQIRDKNDTIKQVKTPWYHH
ncbi:hypothetical protein [Ancylomarina sp.]|uniref:hypothetical protein n=1 Tax=Ancylomarina sp. TaxID=1970196 RepID=UPI00356328CC